MAYVVAHANETFPASAAITPVLLPHQTGDLLLFCLSNDVGTNALTTATSGWAFLGTQAASGGARQAWAWKVAASGSETAPTFSGTNAAWASSCVVVRDAHATEPFGATPTSGSDFVRVDYNNVQTSTSGSLTTAADDALLFYSWCSDGSVSLRWAVDGPVSLSESFGASVSQVVGFRQVAAAGSAPSVTAANSSATEGGNGWIIAVRNKSGGALQPDVRHSVSGEIYYGSMGAALTSAGTWVAPDTLAASINGVGCSSLTAGVTVNITATVLASTESTTSLWVGGVNALSSSLDLSGKVLCGRMVAPNASSGSSRQGVEGHLVAFTDGTNWAAYQVRSTLATWAVLDDLTYVIDVATAAPYATSGTVNWGAITGIGYLFHRRGSSATADSFTIAAFVAYDRLEVVGGDAVRPFTPVDLHRYTNNVWLTDIVRLQGSAQVLVKLPLQVGGPVKTHFDASAASLEFPPAYASAAGGQVAWNAGAGAEGFSVLAGASDTVALGASIQATSVGLTLTFDPATSAAATYDFTGASIVGYAPEWADQVPCARATFKACRLIDGAAAEFDQVTVSGSLSTTSAMRLSAGAALLGCTFVKGAENYAVELTTAGSYDFSETIFSGYTTVLNVSAATGTVTVVLASGQTEPTYTSAGATVVFDLPVESATASITNIVPGSRLQVFNVTENTEMVNTIVAGTSWSDSYPNGTGYTTGDVVRVRLAWMDGTDAKLPVQYQTVAAAGGWSILADQVDDTVYNYNAIDGDTCTEFSHDFANVQVDVDDADNTTTVQRGYAWFIAGQMTADGIRYFFGGITAEDSVNYRINAALVNLRIQNIKAGSNLTVTGGNIYRTDDTDIFAPGASGSTASMRYGRAYTVRVGGGTGLSPEESAKLMSLPSASTVAAAVDASTVIAKEATAAAAKNNAALAAALSA